MDKQVLSSFFWLYNTQLYGFKYLLIIIPGKKLNSPFWAIDGILTGITTQSQSGSESNGKKRVLHIP